MKAAELLVRCLENEGVQLLFGLPGEETLEFMDAPVNSPASSQRGMSRARPSWPTCTAVSPERPESASPR